VNIASLLETNGAPGRVNVSESTHHRVKELFVTEARGIIEASGVVSESSQWPTTPAAAS
jgi:class 3 adenylate cyclase